jgi:DNA-binding MarR family transcriptional regulator
MPRSHPSYSPEFRQQMVELVRAGRTPNELAREFGPTVKSIRNWVKQAEVDEGQRSDGMAMARHRKLVDGVDSSKGEAIADLILEVAQFFFRLRAVGQKAGLFTRWGGGSFGFMRSLALLGPLTVPQIAQMRPTSRQRMQRLADELVAEGLVEFIDNPRHRRSKLVRLTRKGDARYRELSDRFLAIASTMGADLSEADIHKTAEIVRLLSDEAKGLSERLPRSTRLAA